MIDDFAKAYLHSDLREVREVMLWKLEGLDRVRDTSSAHRQWDEPAGFGEAPDVDGVAVLR